MKCINFAAVKERNELIILKLIPLMKAFQTTYGLKKFGYIRDFSAQLAQFNYLLRGTG